MMITIQRYSVALFVLLIAVIGGQSTLSADQDYNVSFKNKSPRTVQIELIQQIKPITNLTTVAVGDMYTATINTKEVTKMHIFYCPDDAWCKKLKPERMTVIFTPNKPIHVTYDGKTVIPQLKRFNNVGSRDIRVIK